MTFWAVLCLLLMLSLTIWPEVITISSFYCKIHELLSNERLSNKILSMFLLSKHHFIDLYYYQSPENTSYYPSTPKAVLISLKSTPKAGVQGAAAP